MALRHVLGEWKRRGAASALTGVLAAAPAFRATGHAVGAAHNTVAQVWASACACHPFFSPLCATVETTMPCHRRGSLLALCPPDKCHVGSVAVRPKLARCCTAVFEPLPGLTCHSGGPKLKTAWVWCFHHLSSDAAMVCGVSVALEMACPCTGSATPVALSREPCTFAAAGFCLACLPDCQRGAAAAGAGCGSSETRLARAAL